MPLDVEQIRGEFPALQRCVYLNTGWAGPRPRSVTKAMMDRLNYESEEGVGQAVVVITAMETKDKCKTALSRLIGATPDELAFFSNTTEALNTVVFGVPLQPNDEVVICDLEHMALVAPCFYAQQRRGANLKVVKINPLDSKADILASFASAVTANTKLVAFSHIQYSCGLRMPVKELVALAKQRGALTLVDGAQAVGHIQVNVKDLDCDFYAFPGHKWLLGPEGVGILYIRKEVIPHVQPLAVAEDAVSAFDFTPKFIPNDKSAGKFTALTHSGVVWAGLNAALDFIQAVGVNEIESQVMESARLIKKALPKLKGVDPLSHQEGELASGLISFGIKGLEPSEVATSLWQSGRVVARWIDYPKCVRLSVGFFNNDRDLNNTFGVLRRAAESAGSEEVLQAVRKMF